MCGLGLSLPTLCVQTRAQEPGRKLLSPATGIKKMLTLLQTWACWQGKSQVLFKSYHWLPEKNIDNTMMRRLRLTLALT